VFIHFVTLERKRSDLFRKINMGGLLILSKAALSAIRRAPQLGQNPRRDDVQDALMPRVHGCAGAAN
jgi:hypothetical protein